MIPQEPEPVVLPLFHPLQRRTVLYRLGSGGLTAVAAASLRPLLAHAQAPTDSDVTRKDVTMAKVIFILQRRADLTREQCLAYWSGEHHTSLVKQVPGLTRWVQNHVQSAPGEPVCDGVGELWFASDEAMEQALNSPQMGAAVEDAKNFLDMDKTGLLIVEEKTIAI